MSTGSSTLAARRGGFLGLRNARLRAKLAGLLVIPLTAVLALGTVRLMEVGERANDAARVAQLADLGSGLANVARALHDERMAAVEYLSGPDAPVTGYREAIKAVDSQTRILRNDRAEITEVPARVGDRLDRIDGHLSGLAELRAAISGRTGVDPAGANQRYGEALALLAGYESLLGQVAEPGPVADGLRSLAAFTDLETAVAEQAAVAYLARASGVLDADRQRAITAAQVNRAEALAEFREIAGRKQIALAESALGDEAVTRADELSTRLTGPQAAGLAEVGETFGDVTELLRAADRQLEEQVVAVAEDESESTGRRATIEFVVVLLVVIAAVALAVYLGRSLLLSVRRLREGALAVAHRDLPEAVTRLHDAENLGEGGVDRILTQTRDPIEMPEQDEFGQVAEAFNMVHREAVRVAAEQAALRTSVSTMFLSLARRSQSLVDRMIGELDQIERMEEDPKRLARLFELDHLATRMRRNDENLLVLAGAEVGAPRREDALLIDTLRAAQSEVELYHRIEFGSIDTDVLVTAAAVNDVVRLIAELLDNATRFSPPSTVVVAHGCRAGDHAVIQVEDRGLGISADQLEQLNRRLTEPSEVDVAAFRLMGFAVIGRLASRHGIQVELRPGPEGGTVAEVTLPADVVVLPGVPAAPPSRAASWTRPGPPPQPPAGMPRTVESRPPIRTAAPATPATPPARPVPAAPSDPDFEPTPDRPPLPTRVPRPASGEPAETPAELPLAPAGTTAPGWGAAMAALPPPPPAGPAVAPTADTPAGSTVAPTADTPAGSTVAPTADTPAGSMAAPTADTPAGSMAAPTADTPTGSTVAPNADTPADSAVAAATSGPAPIRMEVQHSWFTGEAPAVNQHGMPTAGYAPPPTAVPVKSEPAEATMPKPRSSSEDRWRTAADEGWQRALEAAAPKDAGTTRSGLPKRVPQAQLVPGGVQEIPRVQHRRSPDEVRGLLSAYHRGVQRGRTDGVAETAAAAKQAPKEREQ
ncbi:nitrate- and nitrite sensing domain-containing protein [Actinoplanes sp. NPDC049802]|uniref:sensor histidine kinase n=1 Tax=Actinoplanes sp. NPDC049802 TaxID=3154742 RepID=UPI0033C00241